MTMREEEMHLPKTKTDPKLLALLEKAKGYVMTPEEEFEQRVSFVYGQLWNSPLTKEEVRERLRKNCCRGRHHDRQPDDRQGQW